MNEYKKNWVKNATSVLKLGQSEDYNAFEQSPKRQPTLGANQFSPNLNLYKSKLDQTRINPISDVESAMNRRHIARQFKQDRQMRLKAMLTDTEKNKYYK